MTNTEVVTKRKGPKGNGGGLWLFTIGGSLIARLIDLSGETIQNLDLSFPEIETKDLQWGTYLGCVSQGWV
jgi:hypothetical protein